MAELIAQGEGPQERFRRALPLDQSFLLGRSGSWSAAWDDRISRRHVQLLWTGRELQFETLAEARNPLFLRGEPTRSGSLLPGEHFVIGRTTFTVVEEQVSVTGDLPEPEQEQAFSAQFLQRLRFNRPDLRIEYLNRLPDLITSAVTDEELYQRLGNVLLSGFPAAAATAIVSISSERREDGSEPPIRIRHWDRRGPATGEFRPSERLIRATLQRGETLLHVWRAAEAQGYTQYENYDWACCLPVPGAACRGWAIYLTGRTEGPQIAGGISDPWDLRDDLKFCEILAGTLGSLRELRALNRRQASLAPFFSPRVRELLTAEDPDRLLAPREADVTVLFCDLQGFTQQSEAHADALLALLARVGEALGVMSRRILAAGGVLADFQGDAAMGFWGWPLPHPQQVHQALNAALEIRREFSTAAEITDHPLRDFRVGIGIAGGRAVAGKIGTADQVQVTVFGPVVNLAQRLEALTRRMQVEILVDQSTAEWIADHVSPAIAVTRRLATVRPKGLSRPVAVFELRPAEIAAADLFADSYAGALKLLEAGDWSAARMALAALPAAYPGTTFWREVIGPADTAPPDWNGVITLSSK